MKRVFTLILALTLFSACQSPEKDSTGSPPQYDITGIFDMLSYYSTDTEANTLVITMSSDGAVNVSGLGAKISGQLDGDTFNSSFTTNGIPYSISATASNNGNTIKGEWSGNYRTGGFIAQRRTENTAVTIVGGSFYAKAVDVDGDYAFVASLTGFKIFNIKDPGNPILVGTCETTGEAEQIFIRDHFAIIVNNKNGLAFYDITDKSNPVLISAMESIRTSANDIAVTGDTIYLADDYLGIQIIDISDPHYPVFVGTFSDEVDYVNSMAISGTYLYVTGRDDHSVKGIQVIDISDPARPAFVSSLNLSESGKIATVGSHAYIAMKGRICVIDISTPASLSEVEPGVTYSSTSSEANDIQVSNAKLYVSGQDNMLTILNISSPASPEFIGSLNVGNSLEGVSVSGSTAYVAGGDSGLVSLDISNLDSSSFLGKYTDGEFFATYARIKTSGNYLYGVTSVGNFEILNISNPASITQVFPNGGEPLSFVEDFDISGDTLYTISSSGGLSIYSITSDRSGNSLLDSRTIQLTSYNSGVSNMMVNGNYLFVVGTYNSNDGLHIINVSNPARLSYEGSVSSENFRRVFVKDNTAFVAADSDGLKIIDVSIPSSPVVIATVDTISRAFDVQVEGNLAYVTDYETGLRIVNVETPTSPTLLGTFPDKTAQRADVDNDHVYLFTPYDTIKIVNISDPSQPYLSGNYDKKINDLSLGTNTLYVALYPESENTAVNVLDSSKTGSFIKRGQYKDSDPCYVDRLNRIRNSDHLSVRYLAHHSDNFDYGIYAAEKPNIGFLYTDATGDNRVMDSSDDGFSDLGIPFSSDFIDYDLIQDTTGYRILDNSSDILCITDFTYPERPSEMGILLNDGTNDASISVIAVNENIMVAASRKLQIFDISSPSSITLLGETLNLSSDDARAILMNGNYVYTLFGTSEFYITDISTPSNPASTIGYDTGTAGSLYISGTKLYVANKNSGEGIVIFDVSDPIKPVPEGLIQVPGTSSDIVIKDNKLYVADGFGGLRIIGL